MWRHTYCTATVLRQGKLYRLEGQKAPFTHLVYPVPPQGGLGVHATIDLGGNTRFGPDVEWIDIGVDNPDEIDMVGNPKRSAYFYDEVRKYWPGLRDGALQPGYAGVRAKLGHPHLQNGPSIKADFLIQKERGLLNLMGIGRCGGGRINQRWRTVRNDEEKA